MDNDNQTSLLVKSRYNADVALKFFRSAGDAESVAAGKIIFAEDETSNWLFLQRDKMYLLLEGEVELTVKNRSLGVVRKGEIFGEMASITHTTRSATATAKTACSLIALDNKQFQAALRKTPEFAFMLMSVMIERLREIIAQLNAGGTLSAEEKWKESRVFDKKLLDDLVHEFGDGSRMRYAQDKVILQEGQAGVLMYVVLEGVVAITIQDSIVEKVGPGGMFGEMALIERTGRLAGAVAETDCVLLAINRNVFLDLVKANPEFALSLLRAVGERVRFMASRNAQ